MSSSSDSENEKHSVQSRLGKCEVCAVNDALYTCPKCEVKTCCLKCATIHKKELNCDGVRDRTKFIRMKKFTDTDLLSDYRMLEECARFVYAVKMDEKKKFTRVDKELPVHLYKLKIAARKRGTVLQFLSQNFTRHITNTTRYHYKSHTIYWKIEWVFPNAEPQPVKFVDEKCPEHTRISVLLDKYINPNVLTFDGSKALTFYRSVGLAGVKVLIKAEKVKSSIKKFFEVDPMESLAENLNGKCIIENPIIFVILKDHAYNFEIITPEDEFNYNDDKSDSKNANDSQINGESISKDFQKFSQKNAQNRKRPLLTEKIAMEKKIEIEKEMKEERKKKPRNLLFTTGYSSEESLSDSNSESRDT